MRSFVWVLLVVGMGCRHAPDPAATASQFIGTWFSPSDPSLADPYMHWTFNPDYLYTVADTSPRCRPVESQPSRYRVEGNALVIRYAGITNGLFPVQDVRRPIVSITGTQIILDAPRQVLQRCL